MVIKSNTRKEFEEYTRGDNPAMADVEAEVVEDIMWPWFQEMQEINRLKCNLESVGALQKPKKNMP